MPIVRALSVAFLLANCALAQYVVSARAGVIESIVGQVYVDGQLPPVAAGTFPFLKEGQVLSTGAGRAEVLLGPAVFLRLAEQSAIRMVGSRLDNTAVEVQRGTALVEVVDMDKNDRLTIHFGETQTEFKKMGLYRFEAKSAELRVFGGDARVKITGKTVTAGRGRSVHLGHSLSTSRFDLKAKDDFHRWAGLRSFDLFAKSAEAQDRRTHWEKTAFLWSWNRDFGMRLFSPVVAMRYQRKADALAQQAATENDAEKRLENSDPAEVQRERAATAPAAAEASPKK